MLFKCLQKCIDYLIIDVTVNFSCLEQMYFHNVLSGVFCGLSKVAVLLVRASCWALDYVRTSYCTETSQQSYRRIIHHHTVRIRTVVQSMLY